jgi:hypothetical protein
MAGQLLVQAGGRCGADAHKRPPLDLVGFDADAKQPLGEPEVCDRRDVELGKELLRPLTDL